MKCLLVLILVSSAYFCTAQGEVSDVFLAEKNGTFYDDGPVEDEYSSIKDKKKYGTNEDLEGRRTYPTTCEEVRRQSSSDLPSGLYTVYEPGVFENEERGFHMKPKQIECEMDGPAAKQVRGLNTPTDQQAGPVTYARDCTDIFMYYLTGDKTTRSGVYKIYNPKWYHNGPTGVTLLPVYVYCDMKTSGGGWTTFQRRTSKDLSFYRNYYDYTHGFGAINNNYWLGLRFISMITELRKYSLKIDMTSASGVDSYALYNGFKVGDEKTGFKLTIGCYSGNDTYGDRLTYQNGRKFSTHDRDQDGYSGRNCGVYHRGGWWYYNCAYSNLNGDMNYASGNYAVWWGTTSGSGVKKATTMSFRPEHFR